MKVKLNGRTYNNFDFGVLSKEIDDYVWNWAKKVIAMVLAAYSLIAALLYLFDVKLT